MTSEKLYKYELGLLSLLVLVLPSLEALKTFFWFSYLCIFLIRRFQNGSLTLIPKKPANIAVTLYLSATLISTLVNWPFDNGFKGFFDELRFLTLFLCLYSAGYTAEEHRRIALLIVVGVLGGLVYGLVEFLFHFRTDFQFHSAGILTQSSIYLGISILVNAGLLLDKQPMSRKLTNFLRASLLIQLISLVYMGSRGSMLAISLTFVLLAILTFRLRTAMAWLAGAGLSILVISILVQMFPDNIFSKDITRQYSIDRIKSSDSQRIEAWEIAFAKLAEGKDLVWGVGPRNYKAINDMEFVTKDDKLANVKKFGHAHNMFLTQLIEQGIVGLLSMLGFFYIIFQKIISIWRTPPHAVPVWAWYGGMGGFSIPLIAGLFNTPFYQEHAMLAMLVLGIMFAGTGFAPNKND
ncbi:MAG: O-antigen ligase family protein [Gammaproteobacteria bacterium]|nr:O-antigen ligase family protein [Gammaproteobacteria bacterium]